MASITTYRSSSIISVDIYPNGNYQRICFDETNGGSVFRTDNEEVKKALEASSMYGKWFIKTQETVAAAAPKVEAKPETENGKKVVKVSSLTEARDFLVENAECTRSQLKTKEKVLSVAAEKNIVFEGLK